MQLFTRNAPDLGLGVSESLPELTWQHQHPAAFLFISSEEAVRLEPGYLGGLSCQFDGRVVALKIGALHKEEIIVHTIQADEALPTEVRKSIAGSLDYVLERGVALRLGVRSSYWRLYHMQAISEHLADVLKEVVVMSRFNRSVFEFVGHLLPDLNVLSIDLLVLEKELSVHAKNLRAFGGHAPPSNRGRRLLIGPAMEICWPELFTSIEDSYEQLTSDLPCIRQMLERSHSLAESLLARAAGFVSESINHTLFLLSFVALWLTLLTFWDKYQTAETFGMAPMGALVRTLFAAGAVVGVFVLATTWRGSLFPKVRDLRDSIVLRVSDFGIRRGWLTAADVANPWVGRAWSCWVRWNGIEVRTRLKDFGTDSGRWRELAALYGVRWAELERRWAILNARPSTNSPSGRLARLMEFQIVSAAIDSTVMEARDTRCMPLYALACWKISVAFQFSFSSENWAPGEHGCRDRFRYAGGDHAFLTYRALTVALIRLKWTTAAATDEALWTAFVDGFLGEERGPAEVFVERGHMIAELEAIAKNISADELLFWYTPLLELHQ